MLQGKILAASPSLDDPNFSGAVIFIVEHNENGAMGFIINKKFHRTFNELAEFQDSPVFPLFEGGPMEKEHLYFIHERPDLIEEGTRISDGIYFGGNFKQAVSFINDHSLTGEHIKLFIGYCGWDAGELEDEIEEGSWIETITNVF